MLVLLWMFSLVALAGPLDDYKDQKHGDREDVTAQSCEVKYIERCIGECPQGDKDCRNQCKLDAPQFCEERRKRKARKTAEVVAKGGSVAAGGVAVVATNAIAKSRAKKLGYAGQDMDNNGPYTVYYLSPTVIVEGGGGTLLQGTVAGTANVQARYGPVGFGVMNTYIADSTDWLSETDVGPAFYIASPVMIFGVQPSMLFSNGNDVDPLVGGGVRSYSTVHIEQVMLHLDPMLGFINGQWNYHLRAGVSYRITPGFYARLSYDYRDILDLRDLDISQASLQGVMLTLGGRYN